MDGRADGLDVDRGVLEVGGGVGPGDHEGRAAVGRHVAVVETERRGDHAYVEVVVHRHRVAVDRLGVERRVLPAVEGDLGELLAGRAVLVEVALGAHGDPVGGRRGPERQRPLHEAASPKAAAATAAHGDAGPTLVALGRRLPHGSEAEDMVGVARRHRRACGDHRAELARVLQAAVEPVEVEPQGVLQLDDADAGEPRRRVHVAWVGGEPVDVGAGQPGVLDSRQGSVDREVERVPVQAAADVGLSDPRDRSGALAHEPPARGLNSGSHTSSWWSKLTSTGMPT